MHRKELNERSPIRVFENSIHGGLGRRNIGVVVARHGVGKSAFLVGIALDDLMRGKQVLHVDLGKPMDHIREFYDEVFADLVSTNHLEDAPEIRREIESHRHIKAFLANTFSVAKLRAHLAMMKEITGFAPGAVIIDDYDFAKSSVEEMSDLRAVARELDAELWMSSCPTAGSSPTACSPLMAAHFVYPAVDPLPASLSRRWIEGELRGTLGFRGAVFTDGLSMKGAAAFGSILDRARLALAAGYDMLPVCHDRQAVATLLDGLRDEPQPLRQVRLLRLHGRAAPPLAELQASHRWREGAGLSQHCLDVPELRLDA